MQPDQARRIEEESTLRRARLLGLTYTNTAELADKPLFKGLLSTQEMYDLRIVPLQAAEHAITFGITTTTSQQTMTQLRSRFADQQITYNLISDTGYREYMKRFDPPPEVHYQDISISKGTDNNLLQLVSQTLAQVRAEDMLGYLVQQAYKLKGSDIHVETAKDRVRIRFRVDGVLHPIAEMTTDKYRMLMSAIASAANVSTNASEAQSGNISRSYSLADGTSVLINLRVETVPTVYGTDVVLRLFNFRPDFLSLDKLGLAEHERHIVDEVMSHPNGLVLIVGPTGSGKTTTLYSMINELNHPERKIITLEEPVEYVIEGVTQIPVNSTKQTDSFAEKLRAVLRLDPDIIMVGEIRDLDTAKTSLQAALTGHLVMSTYHASSAAAALTRMLDAIGENPLFINSIKLITAQRLVRRLDDATKQAYQPDETTMAYIRQVLTNLPAHVAAPNLDKVTLYKAGTSDEHPFGFTGQMAIRELMTMNPQLQLILRKPPRDISTQELEDAAKQGGMLSIAQDGVLKALQGLTTIEEIARVVAT